MQKNWKENRAICYIFFSYAYATHKKGYRCCPLRKSIVFSLWFLSIYLYWIFINFNLFMFHKVATMFIFEIASANHIFQ